LAAVSLLVFVWSESHRNIAGLPVSQPWEWLRDSDKLFPTLTISSMVIRFAVTAQTGILVAVLASLLLRGDACPLDELPQVLMMRASRVFDPTEIVQSLWSSQKRFWVTFEFLAAVAMTLSVLAIQATSTLLASDLELAELPWTARTANVSFDFLSPPQDPPESLVSHRYITDQPGSVSDPWRSRMAAHPAFAEYAEPPATGNDFVDTGVSARAFLPFADVGRRESIIDFAGPARVLEAQVVCVRPRADVIVTITFDDVNSINNVNRFLNRVTNRTTSTRNLTFADIPANLTRNDKDSDLIFGRLSIAGDFGWDRQLPMLVLPEGTYLGQRIDQCAIPNHSNVTTAKMVRQEQPLPQEAPMSLCRIQEEYQNLTFQKAAVRSLLGQDWRGFNSSSIQDREVLAPVTFLVVRGGADPALWRPFLVSNASAVNITENGGLAFSRRLSGLNSSNTTGDGSWTILRAPGIPAAAGGGGPEIRVSMCFTSNTIKARNITMKARAPRVPEPALSLDMTTGRWNISTLAALLARRNNNVTYNTPGAPLELQPLADWRASNIPNEFIEFNNCTVSCGPGEMEKARKQGGEKYCEVCYTDDLLPKVPEGSWQHREFEMQTTLSGFDSAYLCSFCGADAGLVRAPAMYQSSPPASDEQYRIHRAHTALFQALMDETRGNVAVALQGLFTTLLQSVYYEYAPSLSMAAPATFVSSESVRVPVRWRGLGIVLGVLILHTVAAVTTLVVFWYGGAGAGGRGDAFLGEKWQMFAQAQRSRVMGSILGGVELSRDGEMAERIIRSEGRVVVGLGGSKDGLPYVRRKWGSEN